MLTGKAQSIIFGCGVDVSVITRGKLRSCAGIIYRKWRTGKKETA